MRIFLKDFLIAAAGLSLCVGMAADAVANNSGETPRLAELRPPSAAGDQGISFPKSAKATMAFAVDVLRSAGPAGARIGEPAPPSSAESCSFAGFVEDLEYRQSCGNPFADCPCDIMGTSHGGGGCVGCFR